MGIMKKLSAILLASALLILPSGCGAASKPESSSMPFSEPVYQWGEITGQTLTVWTRAQELNRPYMQKALQNYMDSTGNRLEIVEIPADQLSGRLEQAFTVPGSEQPDIIHNYGGTNIDSLNPDDNLYDFTEAEWVDDLTLTSINQTIYHGKIIGLPHWEASISGTIYNKDIFKKYGISVPQTQAEFMDVCAQLLSHGVAPLYFPYASDTMMLYQFPLDTLVQNAEVLDGLNSGKIGYADLPAMETIVEWYRTMADSGYLGENFRENTWDGMNEAMKSGKYAMMLCWDTWLHSDYDGDASKFGLMPAFVGVPEKGTFEGPNLALMMVNKHSPKLDAALDFVTFLADPYNYNIAFDGVYTAPVFKRQVSGVSTPQYVESERLIERYFHSSTAWLRVKGFSQSDACYIQDYMEGVPGYTAQDCLRDMDAARLKRANDE